MYQYKAKVERVIDGDTAVLDIDLGFNIHHISSCRLYGINAYELKDKDPEKKAKAREGKKLLETLLPAGGEIVVTSMQLDKYGRPLVVIEGVNDRLVQEGLAVVYLLD